MRHFSNFLEIIARRNTLIDAASYSFVNLLVVLVVGLFLGITEVATLSLILLCASFVNAFVYNFVVIPATSLAPHLERRTLAAQALIATFFISAPLVAIFQVVLLLFPIASGDIPLTFENCALMSIYSIANNIFFTYRRVMVHWELTLIPSAYPLAILTILFLVGSLGYGRSLGDFLGPLILVQLMPFLKIMRPLVWLIDFKKTLRGWLKFSRPMLLGSIAQFLSGNLVLFYAIASLSIQDLGQLRLLLSTFGIFSFFFQYLDVSIAKGYFDTGYINLSYRVRGSRTAVGLAACSIVSLTFSAFYFWIVGSSFSLAIAFAYLSYQILTAISIILRARARLMSKMRIVMWGYLAMVFSVSALVVAMKELGAEAGNLWAIMVLYNTSAALMVAVLVFGLARKTGRDSGG